MSLSEAAVQTAIRIRAGELGIILFRNNVGACVDDTGRMIRYGLANDSAQMSKRIKSGDLIGIARRTVRFSNAINAPCALSLGVFLSVECKREDWQGGFPNPIDPAKFNDRERAQQTWIDLVRKNGGCAGFARCVAEFEQILESMP